MSIVKDTKIAYFVINKLSKRIKIAVRAKNLIKYIFARLLDPDFWKTRLKQLLTRG